MACVVGLLELVLEPLRILSLSFRLFGNLFAGDVLLLVINFLLPVVGPIPVLLPGALRGLHSSLRLRLPDPDLHDAGLHGHGHEDAEEAHAAEVSHAAHEEAAAAFVVAEKEAPVA